MRRVCALRQQTRLQYSVVKLTRDNAIVRIVLAPAPQIEPRSCFSNFNIVFCAMRLDDDGR